MKKTLLMLALSGMFSASASAQSNVTVYGSIDAGLRYQTNVNAAGDSLLSMGTGNYYSNRFGFRGVEDLGGGMKARFQFEGGFVSKTGALDNANNVLFNRTAAAGISTNWGSIDVGRQYTIGFRTELFLDPFNHHYTGIVPLSSGAGTTLPAAATAAGLGASSSSGVRFNNDVQYTGTFGPVTARAEYALGEIAGDSSKGSAKAVGLNYVGSALLLAGAYTRKETATGFTNESVVAGGGYKFKAVTLKVGHSREQQATAAAGDYQNKTTWAGASYAVTPVVEVTLAAYRSNFDSLASRGKRDLYLLGGVYTFSKRTNLYAELDLNRYEGALIPATKQDRQRGASVGVNHLF
jgi:predicted porin